MHEVNFGWLVLGYLATLIGVTRTVPTVEEVAWSFEQGQKFYASGAYDQAIDKYAEIIAIESQLLETEEIEYSIGDVTAPVQDASRYQAGNSHLKIAEEQFFLGRSRRSEKERQEYAEKGRENLEQAIHFFAEAEKHTQVPKLKELARNRIVQAWYKVGDYQRTIEEGRALIEKYPESSYVLVAMYDIGWAYYELEEYEQSVATFKALVERFPDGYKSDRALFQIGENYYKQEQYEEALPYFQRLVERAQLDQLTDKEIAKMRREKIAGLVDETGLELALKSQIKVGACHAELGQYDQAASAYRSVVGLFTNERLLAEEAYRRMADMYYEAGDFERSVQTYRSAIDEVTDPVFRARMHSLLAERYYNDGRYAKAIEEYRLYIKAYADVAGRAGFGLDEASYKIGRSFFDMAEAERGRGDTAAAASNYGRAIAEYEKVLEEYPDSWLNLACMFSIGLCQQMIDTEESRAQALARFHNLVEEYPHEEYAQSAFFQIARIHYNRKEYARAIEVYREIIDQYGDFSQVDMVYFEMGISQRRGAAKEDAVASFLKVRPSSDLYSKALQEASQLLMAMEEFDRALEILQEGAKVTADDRGKAQNHYLQGKAFVGKEAYAEAIPHFDRVLALSADPQILESSLYSRGVCYLSLEQYARAEEDLEQLTQAENAKVRRSAQRMLGMVRIRQQKEAQAIFNYQVLAEEAADEAEKAEYLLLLAELYHGLGRNEESAEVARQTIDLPLEDLRAGGGTYSVKERAFYLLGDTYLQKGQFTSVVEVYSKALALYPDGHYAADMVFAIGSAHFELGELNRAVAVLEAFIDRYPDNPNLPHAYYIVGYSYFNQTQFEPAAASFAEAKRFTEREFVVDALYRAGESYFNLGQFDRALNLYREILEKHPHAEEADDALYNMGWAQLELQREDQAIASFEELVTRYPASEFSPNAQFSIGDYYYNKQDYAKALSAYETVLARYPDDPLAEKVPKLVADLREIMAYLDYEQAMVPFRVAMDSKNPAELTREKFGETIPLLREIVDKYPGTETQIGSLVNLGICYESLSRWKEAVAVYERVSQGSGSQVSPDAQRFAQAHKDWIVANRL